MDRRLRRVLEADHGPVASSRAVGGGSIHSALAVRFEDGVERFVKWSAADELSDDASGDASDSASGGDNVFAVEAAGLRALEDALDAGGERVAALRVPAEARTGTADGLSFLVMERIDEASPGGGFFESFGRALAELHRGARSDRHGFGHDNVIGATPQPNPWTEDGVEFVREHRLGHQLRLARESGLSDATLDRLGDRLLERLDQWLGPGFGERDERPSLLHGDLWSGNFLCDEAGRAVLIDPAVYYGHREADLAMSRLFGGFSAAFYRAYEEAWPLPPGSEERIALHQLYHLLNHLNLFGGGYRGRCAGILRRLVG